MQEWWHPLGSRHPPTGHEPLQRRLPWEEGLAWRSEPRPAGSGVRHRHPARCKLQIDVT